MKQHISVSLRRVGRLLAILTPLALCACSLSPEYARPDTDIPDTYALAADEAQASTQNREWWSSFESVALIRLQALALENNHNFSANRLSLAQTIAQARAARSSLLPGISVSGSGSRSGSDSKAGYKVSDAFSGTVQASYELDIWGANRDNAKAYDFEALAGLNAWRGVGLSLESEVALTYFAYLAAKENLALYESTLSIARQVLDYQEKRERLGAAAPLDVSRQRGSVESMEAEYLNYKIKMSDALYSLCALIGANELPEEVAALIEEERLLKLMPPEVQAGLPSELLLRRPDIAEAEARLLAANANIGVARSAFLPGISLSASAGYQSDSLSSLISPASALYSLGASLAATIFDHGRLSAQYDIALAAREELVIRYKEAALTAFLEVSTALTANSLLVDLEKHRERSAAENNEAYRVARSRYTSGAEDFLAVLDAQDTLISAETSLIEARLERLNSAVSLFKSLGGGWGELGSLAEMSYKR